MQHKGKMPHTCQLCGLSFAYKCKLTRHMTTHEDIETRKTFQCMICGKGFAYGKSVTVHMKKVSNGVFTLADTDTNTVSVSASLKTS